MRVREIVIAAAALVLVSAAVISMPGKTPAGSAGVQSTWGLDVITRIVENRSNVVLPIRECKLAGFEEDLITEYRAPSVRRTAPEGRITATVPVPGTFYPAFIFYDSRGAESIGISIDGVELGVATADTDNNQQYLFFLTQPYTFHGGEKLELRALGDRGMYRTEDLLLLKEKPAARQQEYVIRELFGQSQVTGDRAGATLTWITSWPSAGTVEWDGGSIQETVAANNHRVRLTDLVPNRAYRFRINAKTRDGKPVTSEWKEFSTGSPAPAATRVKRARVPLAVEKAASGFPATSGVPFPKGALGTDRQIRLLDVNGSEVPLQTEVLGRWDDGSVKWALLDFHADGPAYSLEYGSEVRRRSFASPLSVTGNADEIAIATGPAKFVISKRRFGFLQSVTVDGQRFLSPENPSAFYLTGGDGTIYSSLAPPDEVAVEESGPLRAVVRVSGSHRASDGRKLFGYIVRFHAYAGQSFLRAQCTFVNDFEGSEFTDIRVLNLRVPLTGSERQPLRWSMGERYSGAFHGTGTVALRQHTDNHYSIDLDGPREAAEGRRAGNWAEWSDGNRTMTLALRGFWQNYPKDLVLSPGGFELALCPPLEANEYAQAKGTVDEHRLYYYLQRGLYKLREGVSKTHDLWLDFARGQAGHSELHERQAPLIATAPAEWYAESRAMGELAPVKSSGLLARYDAFFQQSFETYLGSREKNREYGMLNFGDWWGERVINWGNSEYDTQHAFFMQFTRTGDLRYLRAGEEMEWHNRDVDTVHHHADKTRTGGVYIHCVGHTGDYYRTSPPPGTGIPEGGFKVSHSFIEGHLDYYFLTGDRRSFETAVRIADHYNDALTTNFDFTNLRNPGWHLIMTNAMYQATYDRYYLNAARIVFERVLERQTSDGGWKRFLTDDHCNCLPRHLGNAGFMVGVLLTGLKEYYEITGDERAAESVVRGARFLINDMWIPEVSGFRYTSCPRSPKGVWSTFLLFDGIAFAQQRTQDARLRDVLIAGTDSTLANLPALGKSFTQYTRVTPHFLGYLARLKEEGPPVRGR
jgi:hypothetical protein